LAYNLGCRYQHDPGNALFFFKFSTHSLIDSSVTNLGSRRSRA
jgi:hypothetical protein